MSHQVLIHSYHCHGRQFLTEKFNAFKLIEGSQSSHWLHILPRRCAVSKAHSKICNSERCSLAHYPRFYFKLTILKISTCSSFKTLANAETQFSTGLRSTGVGMCVCAQHEIVCTGGVGDLQKGERYMVYYHSIAEADNMALGIAIWTIFCFLP